MMYWWIAISDFRVQTLESSSTSVNLIPVLYCIILKCWVLSFIDNCYGVFINWNEVCRGLIDLVNRSSAWMFMWARVLDIEKSKQCAYASIHMLATIVANANLSSWWPTAASSRAATHGWCEAAPLWACGIREPRGAGTPLVRVGAPFGAHLRHLADRWQHWPAGDVHLVNCWWRGAMPWLQCRSFPCWGSLPRCTYLCVAGNDAPPPSQTR
jgi:hypothetical protein